MGEVRWGDLYFFIALPLLDNSLYLVDISIDYYEIVTNKTLKKLVGWAKINIINNDDYITKQIAHRIIL